MNQRKAGTILSYVQMGINAVIGFIYIPMLLFFLTKSQYGLYQLVGSFIAYLIIMDFGLGNTITRYYSRYLAENDKIKQENILSTTLILYSVISVFIVAAGLTLLYFLLPFYHNTLTPDDILTVKRVFYIMLFNVAITVPANIFAAVINSHEKFIFARCLTICNSVLQPLLIYIALHFQPNVITVVCIQTLCNLAVISVKIYFCFAQLNVKFKLHFWERKFIGELLSFSFFVFLAIIVEQVYWKTGQIILGAVSGTVAVAIYSITIQIIMVFMMFSGATYSIFLPHISKISAKTADMGLINEIFVKIGRIQFMGISLLISIFCIYGIQFIDLWIGNDFNEVYGYTLILMLALIIPQIQNTGILILQAKNKHRFRSIVYFFIALANIAISIPMAKKYGGLGCAIVTACCLLLGQGIIMNIYYSKIGINIKLFFKNILKMALPVIIICLSGFAVEYFYPSPCIYIFAAKIIVYSSIFCVIMYKFAFNDYEKNLIKTSFEFMKKQQC